MYFVPACIRLLHPWPVDPICMDIHRDIRHRPEQRSHSHSWCRQSAWRLLAHGLDVKADTVRRCVEMSQDNSIATINARPFLMTINITIASPSQKLPLRDPIIKSLALLPSISDPSFLCFSEQRPPSLCYSTFP